MGFYAINRVRYFGALSLNDRVGVLKILLRWQGSVFRLFWIDLSVFMVLYLLLALVYHLVLVRNTTHKENFKSIVTYVKRLGQSVPLSFLLGFFVSSILSRWWQIIMTVPWMASPAFQIQSYLQATTQDASKLTPELRKQHKQLRNLRVTLIRYMNLAWILQLWRLSGQLKKRFSPPVQAPVCFCFSRTTTTASLGGSIANIFSTPRASRCEHQDQHGRHQCVRSKLERINVDPVVRKFFNPLITEEELLVFERKEQDCLKTSTVSYRPEFWLPLQWSSRLLHQAKEIGLLRDDRHFDSLIKMLEWFRRTMVQLGVYNEFNIPLGYTQVVVVAMYTYFICELLSDQLVDDKDASSLFGAYVPLFIILKFLFYFGWFKLGLSLINPLSGEERCEFPMSDMLDFNLQTSSACAAADDFLYPEFLGSKSGSAMEMIDKLHHLTRARYDLMSTEELHPPALPVPPQSADGNTTRSRPTQEAEMTPLV